MTQHTILITGANRGIGLELVRAFYQSGDWHIIACCRNPGKAAELQDLSQAAEESVEIHPLDVTSAASVYALAKQLADRRIDLLLNNAGIMGSPKQGAFDMDFDAWEETFRVNTIAPLRMVQALIGNLRLSSSPKIATISSQMGSLQRESAGAYAYRSSKAAVNKVMQTLSCEMAMENFIITLFHPGWVKTDMGGDQADITTEESAKGLFAKLSTLKSSDNGRFFKWNGEEHPW